MPSLLRWQATPSRLMSRPAGLLTQLEIGIHDRRRSWNMNSQATFHNIFFGQFIFILIIFSMCLSWSTPPHTHTPWRLETIYPFPKMAHEPEKLQHHHREFESFQWHWFIFMLFSAPFILNYTLRAGYLRSNVEMSVSLMPYVRPSVRLAVSLCQIQFTH